MIGKSALALQRSKPILFVAPALGPDVNEIARLLANEQLLKLLVTRTVVPCWLRPVLRKGGLNVLGRRSPSPVLPRLLRSYAWGDGVERLACMMGNSRLAGLDRSFAWIDRQAARLLTESTGAVLAREDACQVVFGHARQRGIRTIYQMPTAFYKTVRALMERETDLFPGVCASASDRDEYAPARCERKDRELALADHVLCHCAFVRRSVERAGFPCTQIKTIPFGVDAERWSAKPERKGNVFLYVGNITLRKGVHRLLRVWKTLRAHRTHTLRLVGDMHLAPAFLRDYAGMYEHVPRVPRGELEPHYHEASAFVFNSVADGFGHVFAEAMACGTAVLCSRNSGAPEIVSDGVTGRLFDFGDDDKLGEVLEWALSHPEALREMGRLARLNAIHCSWERFGDEFVRWINEI
jgi:glycosyltransferase involved in cell wall biosynthesis